MSNQDIYIPADSTRLDNLVEIPQIRLGLQAAGGEGKTWAALTFPNPLVINFNKGLGAHIGRPDVIEIKMYDSTFVDKLIKRKPNAPPNKRDALIKWLNMEGVKLTKNQSLIFDSGTEIEEAHDRQEKEEPIITSSGNVDTLAFWRHKIDWFTELFDIIFSLRCNVVWISHEQVDRDKKGELNGKLKPLLTGQSGDKIIGKFTDWFRQHSSDKPSDDIKPEKLKQWGMTQQEFKLFCNSFPRDTIYYWQTEGDDMFSGKCSSLVNFPKYIPATYESFIKYRRKTS